MKKFVEQWVDGCKRLGRILTSPQAGGPYAHIKPSLGDLAMDRISGFEGIVVGLVKYQFNETRVGIRPRMLVGGVPGEVQYFDISSIEVVEPKVMCVKEPPAQVIAFGVQVTDVVTGIVGIVQGYHQHINGCGRYLVSPDKHDGKTPDLESFTFEQLVVGEQKVICQRVKVDRGGPVKAIRSPRMV